MHKSQLTKSVRQLNELIENFAYRAAHDAFYHEHLVKHENELAPTIGLRNHDREMVGFLNQTTNRSAQPLQLLISDDISVCEWHYRFDHERWGHKDFRQVSVQRWKNGRIIHERHLYKTEKW